MQIYPFLERTWVSERDFGIYEKKDRSNGESILWQSLKQTKFGPEAPTYPCLRVSMPLVKSIP